MENKITKVSVEIGADETTITINVIKDGKPMKDMQYFKKEVIDDTVLALTLAKGDATPLTSDAVIEKVLKLRIGYLAKQLGLTLTEQDIAAIQIEKI